MLANPAIKNATKQSSKTPQDQGFHCQNDMEEVQLQYVPRNDEIGIYIHKGIARGVQKSHEKTGEGSKN